jgi:hypothetical protein
MFNKEQLIVSVIEQIKSDIDSGEHEPICELLNILDVKYLQSYLPEED